MHVWMCVDVCVNVNICIHEAELCNCTDAEKTDSVILPVGWHARPFPVQCS